MTERAIDMKAKKILELEAEAKGLEKQIDKLKGEIQAEMGDREELNTKKYLIKWIFVDSSKFDTKAFKVAHPDLYNIFSKSNSCRRFSVKEANV